MAQTSDSDDLAPALDLLDGVVYVDAAGDVTGVVYYADEVGRYYAVDRYALLGLAERLARGEADAYSLWCADEGADVPSAKTAHKAARKAGLWT